MRAVEALGLNADVSDLASPEGLAASLRRAASFLCPATPRRLVDAVLDVLQPLGADVARQDIGEALEGLIGVGDVIELRAGDSATRLLFLGPPSFVEKRPGRYLLLGIRAGAVPLVDEESLGSEVACEGPTRTVDLDPETAPDALRAAGLQPLTPGQWAGVPRLEPAAAVIEQVRDRLRGSVAPGPIEGLSLIDPESSVRFYKGRWRDPRTGDTGLFVGQRPQAYGASVWCVAECVDGVPRSVLDLPMGSSTAPGWDEGRRVQAALDAERGEPQVFCARATDASAEDHVFDFFSPLPSWAERYLNLAGLPVMKSRGALFSYRIAGGAVEEAERFLADALWMEPTEDVVAK